MAQKVHPSLSTQSSAVVRQQPPETTSFAPCVDRLPLNKGDILRGQQDQVVVRSSKREEGYGTVCILSIYIQQIQCVTGSGGAVNVLVKCWEGFVQ